MCGIFGLISNSRININKIDFLECLNSINHRGPDNEGYKEIHYKKIIFQYIFVGQYY